MKSLTKQWLGFAQADYDVAKLLVSQGKKLGSAYVAAVFHCHQSVEKMLKALLVEQDKDVIKIHDLVRLRHATTVEMPATIQQFIEELNPHYIPPRYPDLSFLPSFSFTYNLKNTTAILNNTHATVLWINKHLSTL